MIRQILYMSVLWTTLIFIGYNLLTTADDNKTNMTIPNEAEAATAESKLKDVCKQMDGEWKDSECKFKDGVEMGKPYSKEQYQVDFDHTLEEEGLWDKYAAEQEDKKYKNICDDVDGKWTKDGCETDHDGPKADKFEEKVTELHQQEQESEPEQIEDWRNTVEEKEPEQIIVEEWEKHHGSPGDDVKIASPIPMTIIENSDDEEKEEESEYEEEEESDESSEESGDDDDSSSEGEGGEEEE